MKSYRLKEKQYACALVRPDERRPSIRTKPYVFATLLFVTLGVITQSGCGGLTTARTNSGATPPSLTNQPGHQAVPLLPTTTLPASPPPPAPHPLHSPDKLAPTHHPTSSAYSS